MYKTVPGHFKSGAILLAEPASDLPEGPVLVTFLESSQIPAGTPALTRAQAAELRGKLASWEADWNAPGMDVYDQP
jgi:hypothetical protein